MRSARTKFLWVGALVVASLCIAACGVPIGPSPQALSPTQVPRAILSRGSQSTTTTQPSGFVPVDVYFLGPSSALTPTQVFVAPGLSTRFAAVLALLFQGPSDLASNEGFTSAIPEGTQVLSVTPDSAPANHLGVSITVTVNLSDEFSSVTGPAQVPAVEQIVYTINELLNGAKVLFQVDGAPISVPNCTGAQAPGAVSAADYFFCVG